MLGIHTVYTPVDRKVIGPIHDMMQFESVTMILSALFWKKFQGPIKLYCDRIFYEYISNLGIVDLWDEIDTETLENLDPDINHDVFWAYSKMYVNSLQTEPFVSLDIDLFQQVYYDYTTHDVIFSHIESTDSNLDNISTFNRPIYYPNYHNLSMFKDRFKDYDIQMTNEAINVAILAINKPEMYKEFMKYVDSFVKGNNFDPLDISTHGFERIRSTFHSSSPITFIEQRLLHSFVTSKGYTLNPIIDLIYSGEDQRWLGNLNEIENPGITHLWGWKVTYRLAENAQERIDLTDFLLHTLQTEFPESYDRYITKGNILKYCDK
jgi:hypothetical protein